MKEIGGLLIRLSFLRHKNHRHWDEYNLSDEFVLPSTWLTTWPRGISANALRTLSAVLLAGVSLEHDAEIELEALDTTLVFHVSITGSTTGTIVLRPPIPANVTIEIEEGGSERQAVVQLRVTDAPLPTPSFRTLLNQVVLPLCEARFSQEWGGAQSVLLSGPCGSGKTALLTTIQAECAKFCELQRVIRINCNELPRLTTAAADKAQRLVTRGVQDATRLLACLEHFCNSRATTASSSSLASSSSAAVLLLVDDAERILRLRLDGNGDGDGLGEVQAGRGGGGGGESALVLAALLRGLLQLLSHSPPPFPVMVVGVTSLPLSAVPQGDTGVPAFEKMLALPRPTREDRCTVLLSLLVDLSAAGSPLEPIDGGAETAAAAWAQRLAGMTAGFQPGDLRSVVKCISSLHAGGSSSVVPWTLGVRAVALIIPAQLRELSDVASSSSYGAGAGGAAKLSWGDFFGNAETVESLARVLRLSGREMSSRKAMAGPASLISARNNSGAVLYGPPGGGKTFLARIAAHECGLNFVSIKSPQLMSKYFGQTEATIRDVFARAREARPCLLFFDDFDALACRRSDGVAAEGGTGLQTRVLSTFLNELDGITGAAGDGGLLVLVACNDLSVLDEALLRPGRLQHHFFVGPLSSKDLGAMLLHRLGPMVEEGGQVSRDDLETLVFQQVLPRLVEAGVTTTGADVEALVRAAVWAAIREQRSSEAPSLLPRHVLSVLPPPPPPPPEPFRYDGSTAFSVGVGGGDGFSFKA